MNKIDYLHLVSTSEAPEKIDVFAALVNYNFFSSSIAIRILSVGLSLGIISLAGQALAVEKLGSRGAQVREIQRCLRQLGYLKANATGNFASLTQAAVIEFQRANGLVADGEVGANTRRLLDSKCRNRGSRRGASGDLALGSRGSVVRTLQGNLQRLGFYNGPINGNFGSMTQQAVIQFQQSRGLRADGVVGIRTKEAILSSLNNFTQLSVRDVGGSDNFPNALNQGDRGSQVIELQNNLRRLRYFTPNSTGFFGSVTRNAVISFQRDYGLRTNGIVDSQTWMTINRAVASLNSGGGINTVCSQVRGEICPGETSQRVVALQKRLQELRFFPGNATGYYGSVTKDAVTQFQRYYRIIPTTGYVDLRTWKALGLGDNKPVDPGAENRYVVVVPIRNDDTLDKVREVVPQAFRAESPRGDYVNAGAFRDRNDASKWSNMLRDYGLDARVEFF